MYCNNCGQKLPDESNFCFRCGHKLRDIKVIIEPVDSSNLKNQIDFEKILAENNVKKIKIVSERKAGEKNIIKDDDFYEEKIEKPPIENKFYEKAEEKIEENKAFEEKIENIPSPKVEEEIQKDDFSISDGNISFSNLSIDAKKPKKKPDLKKKILNFKKNAKAFAEYMVKDELEDDNFSEEFLNQTPKTVSEKAKISEKIEAEKSFTKKESFFKRFKNFLYADDEDNILDDFDELENSKDFHSEKKEEFFENKDHTIKYSKTIIDSKLKEIEDSDRAFENTLIFEDPEYKKMLDLEFKKVKDRPNPFKEIFNFIKGIFISIFEFFKSIPQFFRSNKITKKSAKKDSSFDSNIDIIYSSEENYNGDTVPLIMTEEEKNALNEAIRLENLKKNQKTFFENMNEKLKPTVRKLIAAGPRSRIPMILLTYALCLFDVNLIVNSNMKFALALIKLITIYIILGFATKASHKALEIRLKAFVMNFFVISQALIYKIADSIILYFTVQREKSIEALLDLLSPKFFSFAIIFFLALLMIALTYDRLKERNSTFLFLGWYIVISTALTLVIILINLILITILGTIFLETLF